MTINDPVTESRTLLAIHLFVIVLAALLIGYITYDALNNISFISSQGYLKAQFWICILFILSIVAEMVIKRHFTTWEWISHFLFLIICVPYLSIIVHYDIEISPRLHYFLRFVPIIRAVYALSIVTGAMSKSWIKGLFFSYLMILVASIYFGSMMFYLEEHYVNAAVTDYWTALYGPDHLRQRHQRHHTHRQDTRRSTRRRRADALSRILRLRNRCSHPLQAYDVLSTPTLGSGYIH